MPAHDRPVSPLTTAGLSGWASARRTTVSISPTLSSSPFVALADDADPLSFMADGGFNSPVGRARAANLAAYADDGDGVFVIDAGEIVHAATPATPVDEGAGCYERQRILRSGAS